MDPASPERCRSGEAMADVPEKPSRGNCFGRFFLFLAPVTVPQARSTAFIGHFYDSELYPDKTFLPSGPGEIQKSSRTV